MRNKWLLFAVFLIVMVCIFSTPVAPYIYLAAAWIAFSIGNTELRRDAPLPSSVPAAPWRMPPTPTPSPPSTLQVQLPEKKMPDNIPANLKCPSCGANIKPTDKQCTFCGTSLKPLVELPEPAKLGELEVGKSVRINHPHKGDTVYRTRGRLLYTELWQASGGPNVPWTPTGNYFAGFVLDQNAYLLNWQDRFYILDEAKSLTDVDINRDFLPFARQFAQSNQTARVDFSYNGGRWRMVDIGRFAVEFEDGEGAHLHKGAIGRFIHASGDNNTALVIEDFQSGGTGGQDTLWKGFQIKETDIQI
jgi:hypothetical protein